MSSPTAAGGGGRGGRGGGNDVASQSSSSTSSSSYRVHEEHHLHPSQRLFQAVVENDCDTLSKLFAINARNSVVSFMSMKSRWTRQQQQHQESLGKSGT